MMLRHKIVMMFIMMLFHILSYMLIPVILLYGVLRIKYNWDWIGV
ncbi:hypothetical protein ES702_00704 [subsurface metagenome]